MVEIGIPTEAAPTGDRDHSLNACLLCSLGDAQALGPLHFDSALSRGHGAPAAHIGAKDRQLEFIGSTHEPCGTALKVSIPQDALLALFLCRCLDIMTSARSG